MSLPWNLVVIVDILGSILVLIVSCYCALYARQLTQKQPDNIFRNYLFLFTVAILFFAVSRSFGHLVKQLLVLNDMGPVWQQIAPFSGAVNSTAFVVIFGLGLSFYRFQRVHSEIEYYKENLEEMIVERTRELESSTNTLENILNNSNPINITDVNFNMLRANEAYYELWTRKADNGEIVKCYDSRPGTHCHTDDCPLKLIINGADQVSQEVSKNIDGQVKHFILSARPFKDVDGTLLGMVESFQDITRLKQAESALRESELRFREIFESNPDPVILARLSDGVIIDVNEAFEEATGIPGSEALGRSTAELGIWVDPDQRDQFREKLQSESEVDNFEAEFKTAGMQVKIGLMSARLLRLEGEPYILVVIRDITKEKEAERTLVEMDRMKSEFISTAAHELNTPLSAILGYTEFLQQPENFGGFTEEQRQDFISEIYDRSEALSRIVEDLLDITRIESGRPIPLVLNETDLAEVLSRKIKLFQTQYADHVFQLRLPGASANSLLVMDRHRVEQALDNLLSNAVKYSPKDTTITLVGDAGDDGWEVRVEDQGIGMNAEQLDHIFDKFYRADASNTAASGLGLGMSIVRQIVESHGGQIRVESVAGQGTTARFTLPYVARETDGQPG